MRINKFWIIGFVLIVLIFVVVKIILKDKNSSQETEKNIHPFRGTIQTVVTTTGSVLPENRLEIKPPVYGRIDQILVSEGQMVKIGQIVAWMSSTDRAALLDAARGGGEAELKKWQDTYKAIPLLAPIDGQVIVAKTQPGQTVTSADAVIVLSDHLIVRAQVDETDIGRIKLGQETTITLEAYQDTKIKSKVKHVYFESKTVSNVTVYEVDLLPYEVPAFFRSGMNASVDFLIQKKDNILLLPINAITKNGDKNFVLLKSNDKNKPIRQMVELGITDDKNVEILSGLKEDDEVIMKQKKLSLDKKSAGSNPFMPSRLPGAGAGRK